MSLPPEAVDAFNNAVATQKDEIDEAVDKVMAILEGQDLNVALAVLGNVLGQVIPEESDLEPALNIIVDLAVQVGQAIRNNEVMQ